MFLRTIPLHSADPALINQRKITLYGVRARSIPEDQVEKEIRQEFRNLLTEIFEGNACLHSRISSRVHVKTQ